MAQVPALSVISGNKRRNSMVADPVDLHHDTSPKSGRCSGVSGPRNCAHWPRATTRNSPPPRTSPPGSVTKIATRTVAARAISRTERLFGRGNERQKMKVTCVLTIRSDCKIHSGYNFNNRARPKEAEHSLAWYPVSRAFNPQPSFNHYNMLTEPLYTEE